MADKKVKFDNESEFDKNSAVATSERNEHDENRDPITGEPGSHPFGVAGGGAGGAVTGAAIGGVIGGPIGAAVGGAVGAVAGGLAGKAAAEALNPTTENEYWRENYKNRPYYTEGSSYDEYEPAYRYGWESAARKEHRNRRFDEIEGDLQRAWESDPGYSTRPWKEVRDVSRDSYDRAYTQLSDTGDYRSGRSSVWNQVEGNWHQLKGSIKARWNELTDDDIEAMDGRREQIIGKIQEKYGEERWNDREIETELEKMERTKP